MSALKEDFRHHSHPAYTDTVCAVNSACLAARIAYEEKGNRLAREFIYATQDYRDFLNTLCTRLEQDFPLKQAYLAARDHVPCPLKGKIPDLLRNRVEAELALIHNSSAGQQALDRMVATGTAYMRTRTDLAVMLPHLPLAEKIWNQIKYSLHR